MSSKAWRDANKDKVYGYYKKWAERNRPKIAKDMREWRAKRSEHVKAWRKKHTENNRERLRQYQRQYREQNRLELNVHARVANVKRKKYVITATPKWANDFFIKEIYHLAALRTKMLGYKWQVDHIVPLRSKLVCGLHVENNMRVIPQKDNQFKSNCYWPEMP